MEQKHLCAQTDDEMIRNFSQALLAHGVTDGADCYYTDEEYPYPFFKLPKAYKKESPTDPDTHYVFVDVEEKTGPHGGEYTVQGNYVHEHIPDADRAANLVADLLRGAIVEVALVYPDRFAGFFVGNTGDPQKNVDIISEHADEILGFLKDAAGLRGGHMHVLFSRAHPNKLQFGPTTSHRIAGVSIYLVSSVLAEHPEFYVIQ